MNRIQHSLLKVVEFLENCLRKNWLRLKKRVRNTVISYERRRSLLILDMLLYSLTIVIPILIFLVTPTLETERKETFGLILLTLIISFMFVYSEVKKYILARSQRKLNHWLKHS